MDLEQNIKTQIKLAENEFNTLSHEKELTINKLKKIEMRQIELQGEHKALTKLLEKPIPTESTTEAPPLKMEFIEPPNGKGIPQGKKKQDIAKA